MGKAVLCGVQSLVTSAVAVPGGASHSASRTFQGWVIPLANLSCAITTLSTLNFYTLSPYQEKDAFHARRRP